jgi:uncharacterized protein
MALEVARPPGGSPVDEVKGHIDILFRHTLGPYYERFFEEMANGKIMGIECTGCGVVLIPPRPYCSFCYAPTGDWVELSDEGRIMTYTRVHVPFPGQPVEPPYTFAFIMLDGADVHFPHILGEVDPGDVAVGMRVKAKWAEDRKGTLHDIEYFRPAT